MSSGANEMKGEFSDHRSSEGALGLCLSERDVDSPWRGGKRGRESNPDCGLRSARDRCRRDHRVEGDGQGKLDQSQLRLTRRPLRRYTSVRDRARGEEGSVVEAAIAIPAAMLVIL